MQNIFTSTLLATAIATLAGTADAGLMLAFTADGSDTSVSLSPSVPAEVPVYLVQTNTSSEHPDFGSGVGLNVFGVAGALLGDGIEVVAAPFTFAAPFIDQGLLNPSTSTTTSFVMNGFAPSPGISGEAILLGSVTVQGITPGASATLRLSDPSAVLDDFAASPSFGSIDAAVFETVAELHITVSPNPAGDFNADGITDAADYTVWRDSLGAAGDGLNADANDDRTVDIADYEIWRDNFGAPAIATAARVTSLAMPIPEPGSLVLTCTIAACGLGCSGPRSPLAAC